MLVLLATAGMIMMISANDLIALYLGLELQSLALYVVAAFRRDDVRSSEAGLKYFVLGALSSGMLLYGASLIYGFTGSTSFAAIAAAAKAAAPAQDIGLIFGLVFLLVGLAFKISAVPFHMWTPDVYEGAPTPVTAFFAAAPKVAAMALLMRVTLGAFAGIGPQWQQVVAALAIASMGLGAFAAIGQTNIKRLLAYSAIGNIGYALIGLAAASPEGARGVIIYMVIYVAMTLGAFACVLAMRRQGGMVEEIDELSGLAQTNLGMATVLALLMFSLAGIPPLAGFFAKFYVFVAAVKEGLWALAVFGVLASVVGAYYYVRIVKIMFFDAPKERFLGVPAEGGAGHGARRPLRAALRGLAGAAGRGRRRRGQDPVLGREPLTDRSPPSPRQHVILDEAGSTNTEAFKRAAAGEAGPLWIMARRQTQGRGRSGRQWASEPGNLYASLLQRLACPQAVVHQLSLLAGVAVVEAIGAAAGGRIAGLRLKWPNDVLIGEAKCAGILPESQSAGAASEVVVVIGVGINLASHPRRPRPRGDRPCRARRRRGARRRCWACWRRPCSAGSASGTCGAGFAQVRAAWLAARRRRWARASPSTPGASASPAASSASTTAARSLLRDAQGLRAHAHLRRCHAGARPAARTRA